MCFDFAVIGSGVAGLRYALEVSKHGTVDVITKAEPQESNTNYAQGGISAVLSPSDSVESHMQDTIIARAHLCDDETVRVVCTEGPQRIRELIAMGAMIAREGGHSHHIIVHVADMTGREIERALLEAAVKEEDGEEGYLVQRVRQSTEDAEESDMEVVNDTEKVRKLKMIRINRELTWSSRQAAAN